MNSLTALSIDANTDLDYDFGLSTLPSLQTIFWCSTDGLAHQVNRAFSKTACNSIVFDNNGALLDCSGLSLSNCSNLQSINLSNAIGLTSIYNGLFTGC